MKDLAPPSPMAAAMPVAAWAPAWSAAAASAHFAVEVGAGERRQLARAWLLLAIAALAASGVFSVLLVVARTPLLQSWLPAGDFFRVALIVHVDLSVLVWFGAFAAALWSSAGSGRWMPVAWVAWMAALLGAVGLCVAPFLEAGRPVMANYVPVIESGIFLRGLMLFGLGFGLMALRAMAVPRRVGTDLSGRGALHFGLNAAAVAAVMAVLAFGWSWLAVPRALDARTYYELLFWGPGHVLQFCWSLLLMFAWLWLSSVVGARPPLGPRVVALLFGIGLAAVFLTPLIYLSFDVASVEFQRLFTWQMRFGGGLALAPVAVAVVIGLLRRGRRRDADVRPAGAALRASLLLFGAGGAIGFLIQGSDVRIPAHYHGSIVGITLALMGLTYTLLPRLGYTRPLPRAAAWQPWLYGGGQLLHIVGLLWSGGYGVQRKVAGAEQVLRTPAEIAGMGLMGFGGLIAVLGGLLFALIVIRSLRRPE